MTIEALGDSAVVVSLGSGIDESALPKVRALAEAIDRIRAPAVLDAVPAFSTVAVYYDPLRFAGYAEKPFENICRFVKDCAEGVGRGVGRGHAPDSAVAVGDCTIRSMTPLPIEIPVCYGGEFGPDLGEVAAHCGLSAEEVCLRHSGAGYVVHAIGFVPGFPYLAGLPKELNVARRASPRLSVAAGSVGIGGAQTGVYPVATPGGWQIIGRSPSELFSPRRTPPSLLRAGDRVRFVAITREEFERNAKGSGPEFCTQYGIQGLTPCLEVIRPGMLTTVQDLGRTGHRASGVPVSGAMDAPALRAANALVGNPEGAAALEITLVGPEIEFLVETLVAMGGAEFEGMRPGQARLMKAGERLKLGSCATGCRGYLAVAGGLEVPAVLGSRSTYLRGGFGGFEGRALKAGDRLARNAKGSGPEFCTQYRIQGLTPSPTIRAIRGAQGNEFGDSIFGPEFKVSPQSDRMGLRLSGAALERRRGKELVSGAVAPGTVQIPPDGQPIVLAADAQTIGGYPQAAHVISADLPILAQLRPGDSVRFREVLLADAHAALIGR
jgi:KipI family sensor histidine kinase inhibitor